VAHGVVEQFISEYNKKNKTKYSDREQVEVYHGSKADFEEFDFSHLKDELGVFFAENENDASQYGDAKAYTLSPKKTLVVHQGEEYRRLMMTGETDAEKRERLIKEGYDTIKLVYNKPGGGETVDWVALTPDVINKTKYSDRDSSYLDAVNRGDMETAQRMVDEAAEKAGYTDKAYHGTPQFGFTKFDAKMSDDMLSLFFTDDFWVASTYAGRDVYKPKRLSSVKSFKYEKGKIYTEQELMEAHNFVQSLYHVYGTTKVNVEKQTLTHAGTRYTAKQLLEMADSLSKKGIYEVYLNTNNLLEIDAMWSGWAGLHYPDGSGGRVNTRDIAKYAKEHGYNGVKVTNVYDWGGLNPPVTARMERNGEGDATIFIVFDSNQIKSADPVTYDDEGNVIPLSQRFKAENDDIRYQDRLSPEESFSNRSLLANALLDTVQSDIEYKKLDDYKAVIGYLEAEEVKLADLKRKIYEATFGDGDKSKLKELREEARKTEARIDLHDKKLLQLESTTALKNVLERARKDSYTVFNLHYFYLEWQRDMNEEAGHTTRLR
jgi:hypothetical protein